MRIFIALQIIYQQHISDQSCWIGCVNLFKTYHSLKHTPHKHFNRPPNSRDNLNKILTRWSPALYDPAQTKLSRRNIHQEVFNGIIRGSPKPILSKIQTFSCLATQHDEEVCTILRPEQDINSETLRTDSKAAYVDFRLVPGVTIDIISHSVEPLITMCMQQENQDVMAGYRQNSKFPEKWPTMLQSVVMRFNT